TSYFKLPISYLILLISKNSSFALTIPMQRLLYILAYPILWLLSILPMRVLYVKSTALYFLVYYIIGYRKKVVKDNLALAFPEKPKQERDRIAKQRSEERRVGKERKSRLERSNSKKIKRPQRSQK